MASPLHLILHHIIYIALNSLDDADQTKDDENSVLNILHVVVARPR